MVLVREAVASDLPGLHPLIERAYRGDAARVGWTHEAELVFGPRTDLATLTGLLDGDTRLLVACEDDVLLGCVYIGDCGDCHAHLGMLCVDPVLQTGGIGKRLMNAAEDAARRVFGATSIELTVISGREPLIAYYRRRGYAPTGEVRPFPVALDPPLQVEVLAKSLDQSTECLVARRSGA